MEHTVQLCNCWSLSGARLQCHPPHRQQEPSGLSPQHLGCACREAVEHALCTDTQQCTLHLEQPLCQHHKSAWTAILEGRSSHMVQQQPFDTGGKGTGHAGQVHCYQPAAPLPPALPPTCLQLPAGAYPSSRCSECWHAALHCSAHGAHCCLQLPATTTKPMDRSLQTTAAWVYALKGSCMPDNPPSRPHMDCCLLWNALLSAATSDRTICLRRPLDDLPPSPGYDPSQFCC